jgi:Mg-chelatase subunit ChlD
VVAGSGVGVEILLDTSNSMLKKIGKQSRLDIANGVMRRLIGETLPEGVPVAVRIFDPAKRCGSTLLAPLAPLERASMLAKVSKVKAGKHTKTPIASTLQQVAADLSQAKGMGVVVLVTDGRESCGGDPQAAIEAIRASGLDVRINIVGFAIQDQDLKDKMAQWAQMGGGQSFDAEDSDSLLAGVAQALAAPFRVLDATGTVVATGVVGGDPVSLPPGSYRVEVLTDPVRVYEDVVVQPGLSHRIQIEAPAGGSPSEAPGVSQ